MLQLHQVVSDIRFLVLENILSFTQEGEHPSQALSNLFPFRIKLDGTIYPPLNILQGGNPLHTSSSSTKFIIRFLSSLA